MQESKPAVMVVEDEPGVLSLIVTILRLSGLVALPCADAVAAEDLMAIHGAGIQLLVTDVNLGPDSDGVELARGLQERYPNLRVLYVSGLVDEGPVALEVAAGRAYSIAKPFTPRSLTHRVTSILEARYRMAPGAPVLD